MGKQVKNGRFRKAGKKKWDSASSRGLRLGSQLRRQPQTPYPLPQQHCKVLRNQGSCSPLPACTPPLAWPSSPRSPQIRPPFPEERVSKGRFPEAFSRTQLAETSAKVGRPEKLEEEASQSCYLVETLETETAATVATLLPHDACLSPTDIETAAILLQADTRTDHRKGQASFVFKPMKPQRKRVVGRGRGAGLIWFLLGVLLNNGVF